MKNIFLIILITLFSTTVFSQEKNTYSTSFSIAHRSYAPVVGNALNEEPVFEFYQTFSCNRFSLLFIKSVDLVDNQSSGNYSFLLGKYQFIKNETFTMWLSGTIIQSDEEFIPVGDPLFIFQTGFSKKIQKNSFGLRTSLIRTFTRESKNTFVINPFGVFALQGNKSIQSDIWFQEDHITLGIGYRSQLFDFDQGKLNAEIRYNYRHNWENASQEGLVNFGITYTLK
ncbi:MAG: hypothetical protein MRY57_02855 [Candidatus Pacebacteria bacterium]|nr:hypothetical protein [Candidatus Paceibacterota bacterium]